MSRRIIIGKKLPQPDLNYNNLLLSILINRILKDGKKELARKIVYKAYELIRTRTSYYNILKLIERAIKHSSPKVCLKIWKFKKRTNVTIRKIPIFLSRFKSINLGIKLIVIYAKKRPGKNIAIKLANEIMDASQFSGNAVRKKEELHKAAEANRAFVM